MTRAAIKVDEAGSINRQITIPGWVYNLFIEKANREKRPVKNQIELELEQLAEQHKRLLEAR
jgi:hypothetical protein